MGTLGLFTDVTEQKQAEQQLRQHEAEAALWGRLHTVGEMAATLAHEINQPLYAINNYVQGTRRRLQRERAPNVEELLEVMEQVAAEVNRASGIISHLREFVRRREPHRSSIRIDELLHQAVSLMEPEIRDKEITVDIRLAQDLPTIHADPIQVEQVLVNLVGNAVDAMQEVPHSRRRLTITAESSDEGVIEVAVRDCGAGLTIGCDLSGRN